MDEILVIVKGKIDTEDQDGVDLGPDHVQGPENDAAEDVTVHQEGKVTCILSFHPF